MPIVALGMAFAMLLLLANILAAKPIGIIGLILPGGIIAYPFTYLITDSISELYGRGAAIKIVWYGFVFSLAAAVFVIAGQLLPPAPFWEHQAAYDVILGLVPRIVFASLIAYLISQHIDVIIFHVLRRTTNTRHLWLRNNSSTLLSQAVDTAIFIPIAFAGVVPADTLVGMLIAQYLVKVLIALLDTPLVYVIVALLRSKANSAPIPV